MTRASLLTCAAAVVAAGCQIANAHDFEAKRMAREWSDLSQACPGAPGAYSVKTEQCRKKRSLEASLKTHSYCFGPRTERFVTCGSADAERLEMGAEKDASDQIIQQINNPDPNAHLGDFARSDFRTKEGGLMCDFPGHMAQAGQAVVDPKWLKDIGCVMTRAGLKVVRINDDGPVRHGEWNVRVLTESGESASMFTYSCNLAFPDGTPVRVCY